MLSKSESFVIHSLPVWLRKGHASSVAGCQYGRPLTWLFLFEAVLQIVCAWRCVPAITRALVSWMGCFRPEWLTSSTWLRALSKCGHFHQGGTPVWRTSPSGCSPQLFALNSWMPVDRHTLRLAVLGFGAPGFTTQASSSNIPVDEIMVPDDDQILPLYLMLF